MFINGLEVLPSDTPIAYEQEDFIEEAKRQEFFIRNVRVPSSTHSIFEGLNELLTHADNELNELAAFCGATVVNHSWLLVENPSNEGYRQPLVPTGFRLVARVESIRQAEPVYGGEYFDRVSEGIKKYQLDRSNVFPKGHKLSDVKHTHQFVTGLRGSHSEIGLFLPDIEPRFAW